jgi:hypothetical protein
MVDLLELLCDVPSELVSGYNIRSLAEKAKDTETRTGSRDAGNLYITGERRSLCLITNT